MDWVKFRPSAWWKATRSIPPEKRGEYMDLTMEAVEDGKRGVSPLADALLDEAEDFIGKKRAAGRKGGEARARGLSARDERKTGLSVPSNAKHTLAHSSHNINSTINITPTLTDPIMRARDPEAKDEKPQQKKSESGNGKKKEMFSWSRLAEDRYEYINSVCTSDLPFFATWYCGEQKNVRAADIYGRFIRKHGGMSFRQLIERFIADVESGEEPAVRGAAFMARIQRADRDAQDENKN